MANKNFVVKNGITVGTTDVVSSSGEWIGGSSAGTYSNSAFGTANTADQKAVTSGSYANSAYLQANSAYLSQNSTGNYANSAYGVANSASSYANGAFTAANTANTNAISAGSYANSAYSFANTANGYFYGVNALQNTNITSASSYANGAFTAANTADQKGVSAGSYANGAYGVANSASSYANGAFTAANTADQKGVSAGSYANSAYTLANTVNVYSSNAYSFANTSNSYFYGVNALQNTNITSASSYANGAFTVANTANGYFYGVNAQQNTNITSASSYANGAFVAANTADQKGVSAGSYANSAYTKANNALVNSTGTFSGDLTISGNLTVQGTTLTVNVSTLSVNDSIMLLGSNNTTDSIDIGFVGHYAANNIHTGLIRHAADDTYYLFKKYPIDPYTNVIDIANTQFTIATLKANLTSDVVSIRGYDPINHTNTAYTQANTATTNAATADQRAVTSGSYANSAYGVANSASSYANGAFTKSNTAVTIGSTAVTLGNTFTTIAGLTGLTSSAITDSGLTSGRITYAGTGGLLTDSANLKFDGTNVGIGITPSSWGGTVRAEEYGTSGSQGATWLLNNGSLYSSFNNYYDGTNFLYKNSSYATLYNHGTSGTHAWSVAASGIAGATISWTTAMTIDNSGRLGVGTSSPAAKLDVVGGTLRAMGWVDAASGTSLELGYSSGSASGYIQSYDRSASAWKNLNIGASTTTFNTDGSTRATINTSGNFLIGTTTSYSRLTVSNGSSTRSIITISDTNTASLMLGAGNSLPATIGTDAASGIRFLTGSGAGNESGTELMRYNSTGLGIGTTSPYNKLAINGSDPVLYLVNSKTAANGNIARLTLNPAGGFDNATYYKLGPSIDGYLENSSTNLAALVFSTYNGSSLLERMRIDSSGNVGIGTPSPATKLSATATRHGNADGLSANLNAIQWEISGQGYTSVVSNISSSAGSYNAGLLVKLGSTDSTDKILDLESGGVNRFRVTGAGRVGIGLGTGLPRALLDIGGRNTPQVILIAEDTGNVRVGFGTAPENAAMRIFSVDGIRIGSVSTSDGSTWSEWMRIHSNGRVGIGTTAPNYLLSVYGASGDLFNLQTSAGMGTAGEAIGINFSQSTNVQVAGIQALTTSNSNIALTFGTYSSGYSEKMRITSTGYVGMGNTSPNYKLDVGTGEGSQSTTRGSLGCYRNATGADSSPYTQARLIIYGGTGIDTGNYGYFAYGADASFRFVYAKTSSGTNPLLFGTTSAMDGTGSFTETLRLDTSGNLKLSASGSKVVNSSGNTILQQTGSVVQTQYLSSATRVATTHTGWAEPSTAYRISITPTSTGSMIILRFFVACQVNSAQNVLQLFRAFRTVGGGANNYALTSAGTTNESRHVIAGHSNRPWNGYDSNDVMNWMVEVIDFPGTTSTCTYGFETNPEAGNSTYFGYTNSNSGTWGFDTDIVIVAQEIAQ